MTLRDLYPDVRLYSEMMLGGRRRGEVGGRERASEEGEREGD